MDVSADALMDIFKNRGIRSSYTRMRIMQYLMVNRNHSTADEIYGSLVEEIPTLSRTTVYNSLHAFVEAGLARVVTIEDNEARYDSDISDTVISSAIHAEGYTTLLWMWTVYNQRLWRSLE